MPYRGEKQAGDDEHQPGDTEPFDSAHRLALIGKAGSDFHLFSSVFRLRERSSNGLRTLVIP